MKKNLTHFFLSLVLVVLAAATAKAQTDAGNFIFQIVSPTSIAANYEYQDCGYGGSVSWGAAVTEDVCGQVMWGYTAAGDSLGCAPITTDLTGKIALIRRGVCNFSLKAYHAQQAGAIGVVIINHFANATEDDCYVINMSAGDSAAAVTIPAIMGARALGEPIAQALAAGQTVQACFALPRMYNPVAPYHYATPVNHVDTLNHIGVNFVNRESTPITNLTITADITRPDGNLDQLAVTLGEISAGADTFVYLPAYVPPSILGHFDICFSNSFYTESRDTVCTDWVHTEHTFASDRLTIDSFGVGPSNQQFIDAGFYVQSAALYITGPVEDRATYITFGLSNVDSVYVPDPGANIIGVILYDGDANDDNVIDLVDNFQDLEILSLVTYEFDGTEAVDSLISVPLQDDAGNPYVQLEARHPYYASLFYNGEAAATGRAVRFSNSLDVTYLAFPTTPLLLGTFFNGGWAGAIVIQRLQMEGFDPTVSGTQNPLDAAKLSIQPNPATDQLMVDLKLNEVNAKVAVSLHDIRGNAVRQQNLTNFQNGQVVFQVNDLPAGTYVLFVRTAEGASLKKVVIH
jgi:hypothetical protein